jgi:hypothetical protein
MDGDGSRRRRRTTPVGRTGARFGPASIQSDHRPPASPPPDPGIGPIGARFGPYSARRAGDDPHDPGYDPDEPAWPAPLPRTQPARAQPPPESLPSESHVLIRPYARTGGRTRPAHDLAIEALVRTAPAAPGRSLSREHRAVANLCVHPRSVAEVAALLRIPLGVARVLLGDLATDGTVVVHRTSHLPPDLALLGRVLTGLRRL